ncbi:acyltransferase family protein [Pseudomonas guariconensis]|uniref:acyltransferase family protein n=1 Tax=Pseudomonas guariconensis TaxID=1288410 RepID=UPI0018D8B6D8|nr:acyltransferase family protein [Pseudomonas guariconensis]MBH3360516.1 acyltransferase [Pseudomonas guariconensis]
MVTLASSPGAQKRNSHPSYRPDIDGLRAVAILSVVLFHAFPSVFPGGFVGVDVFFVISGYLISSIIFKSLAGGALGFTDFYVHRVNRIFPALVVVVCFVYVFGWLSLLPDEFKQLGLHVSAGSWFVENFVLWSETGYFDVASELKPLMHLWSLAVEEQFYLIFPVLMWATWRLRLNFLIVVVLAFLSSFFMNVYSIHDDPSKTFFMPYTRLWELLAGSILACVTYKDEVRSKFWCSGAFKNFSSLVGVALVFVPVFAFNGESLFPGWLALAPVLGAAIIIGGGRGSWVSKNILSSRVMVFVGLISYPLYLWHWPILSYYRILKSDSVSLLGFSICVVLSFVAAWLTYKLVELPLRRSIKFKLKPVVLGGAIVCVGIVGVLTYRNEGFSDRLVVKINPSLENNPSGSGYMQKGCGLSPDVEKKFPFCIRDRRGDAEFALIGDSKAGAMTGGIFRRSSSDRYWVALSGNGPNGAPAPIISDDPIYSSFQDLGRIAIDRLSNDEKIKVVVVVVATRNLFHLKAIDSIQDLPGSNNYQRAREGLSTAVKMLVGSGKKVVFVVDNPTLKDPKKCISRVTSSNAANDLIGLGRMTDCSISYDEHLVLSKKYRQLLSEIEGDHPGVVKVFDGLDLLCDMKERSCKSFSEGRLLYSYSDHVSNFAGERIAERLIPFVEQFANEGAGMRAGR